MPRDHNFTKERNRQFRKNEGDIVKIVIVVIKDDIM